MLNMKVAIFLAGFGMALAIAAPAPISDRKKRDVPHSVIQPTDDPFGNTAPSDAFPINFPISKAPIPVNPFDFNPPSTAQPSDILSSNIPISKTPLPINPFDNNLPPSGVFPSTPNITATIDVPGKENGSSTAVVVACDGPNFTGTCVRVIAPLGQCGKESLLSESPDTFKAWKMRIMLISRWYEQWLGQPARGPMGPLAPCKLQVMCYALFSSEYDSTHFHDDANTVWRSLIIPLQSAWLSPWSRFWNVPISWYFRFAGNSVRQHNQQLFLRGARSWHLMRFCYLKPCRHVSYGIISRVLLHLSDNLRYLLPKRNRCTSNCLIVEYRSKCLVIRHYQNYFHNGNWHLIAKISIDFCV